MDKQQITAFIEGQLAAGKISREDLLLLANNGSMPSQSVSPVSPTNVEASHKEDSSKNLINVFYGILYFKKEGFSKSSIAI